MKNEANNNAGISKVYVGIIIVLAVAVVLVGGLLISKTLNSPEVSGVATFGTSEGVGEGQQKIEAFDAETGEAIAIGPVEEANKDE